MKCCSRSFGVPLCFWLLLAGIGALPGNAWADESSPESNRRATQLETAKKSVVESQEFVLRHKYASDETLRWKVTHLATTETTIQGNTQTSKSSSISIKAWKIKNVNAAGQMTLVHMVESVNMWQNITGRQEVRYNSEADESAPLEYESVAATVGKPLATVTIDASGKVLQREGDQKTYNFGVGDLVLPLPDGPVKLGAVWHVPSELTVRLGADGRVQRIKTRLAYTLEKVQTGVATIGVKTEVLTPVNDPKVQSQIMQQLTSGTIRFDMDAGRLISKQIDWDETVVAFNGPDSTMKYLARFTEELLPPSVATARK